MRTTGPSCSKCTTSLLGLAIGFTAVVATIGFIGCRQAPSATVAAAQSGSDPADANLAPVTPYQAQQPTSAPAQAQPARVLGQRAQNESQQRADFTAALRRTAFST